MNVQIQPNTVQKFVLVESSNDIFLWGDPNAKFHKDIVSKMQDSGIPVVNVRGGAKINIEKDRIYIWGESSVYGGVSFQEVQNILKEKFPEHRFINNNPKE